MERSLPYYQDDGNQKRENKENIETRFTKRPWLVPIEAWAGRAFCPKSLKGIP